MMAVPSTKERAVMPDNIGKRFDLVGLPAELIAQLQPTLRPVEQSILDAINSLDGMATLNEILVALWRRDGKVRTRDAIYSRLYRMLAKGDLVRVPGHRATYAACPSPAGAR